MATENQSPSGVGVVSERTVSRTALAADAADDSPRASMIAAPRFCTVEMNPPSNHSVSVITSGTGLPSMRALAKSGNWVAEWFPQMATLLTAETGTPAFLASWDLARFSSSRIMANHRSAGTSGAADRAIRQLVLHGLPTTSTRTSEAACSAIAAPWGLKMPPFTPRSSPRSIPAFRGIDPTSSAQVVPSNAVFMSVVATTSASGEKAQSSSSMTTPSKAFMAGSISKSRSTIGWSTPRSCPEAIRNRSE